MYSSQQQITSPEVIELRKEAGLWLKELREKRGLSQRQMAEKVGGNYYTFISQLESGRGRIPPDRYLVWAEVLGVEPKFFVRNLLRSYDPVTYSILFGKSKPSEVGHQGHQHFRSIVLFGLRELGGAWPRRL